MNFLLTPSAVCHMDIPLELYNKITNFLSVELDVIISKTFIAGGMITVAKIETLKFSMN